MMRTLMVFSLEPPKQLSLDNHVYISDEGLNLGSCLKSLESRLARYDQDGDFVTAGFLHPKALDGRVTSFLIFEKRVGRYAVAKYNTASEDLYEEEEDPSYFKQAIVEFRPAQVVLYMSSMADKSAIRQTVEAVVNEWGFAIRPHRLTTEMFRRISHNFKTLAMTITNIEVEADATSKVKLYLDPAREAESIVQSMYEDRGDISHLKVVVMFDNMGYSVKLYPDGTVALDDENLPDEKVERFASYVITHVLLGLEMEVSSDGLHRTKTPPGRAS